MMRAVVINCPVDYDETTCKSPDIHEDHLMITQNISVTSSQECVGLHPIFPPTILKSKDRLNIQNLKKIHDTYNVVEKKYTRGTGIEDNLLPTNKVRWKDNVDTMTANKKD